MLGSTHHLKIIQWNPPSHIEAVNTFYQILGSTAGQDIRDAVHASKEPPIPQLADLFKSKDSYPLPTLEFWRLCQKREQFRAEYNSYWQSTQEVTSNKRPVDGVILPVAPHAATPEGLFKYYGNNLDLH